MIALNCPVCHAPFKEIVKDRVLIDVCTECRGIWLDRGELDKLLDIARADGENDIQNGDHSNRRKSRFESWLEPL